MPQTGAAGFRRSDRHGDSMPAPIVGFDPVGEISAYDNRESMAPQRRRDVRAGRRPAEGSRWEAEEARWSAEDSRSAAREARWADEERRWMAEESQPESRAAARAAMAEAFAAQFGVDEESPSAASLAERFGFRFEESEAGSVGRRTVTITGHGAERSVPPAERSVRRGGGEPRRRPGRSDPLIGLHADRAALWAVGLALVLALVAAMSAHALPLH